MIVHRFIQFPNVSANLELLLDALMCVMCGQVGTACQARRSKQRVPETTQSAWLKTDRGNTCSTTNVITASRVSVQHPFKRS
jgi:hypothetical protein